MVTLEKHEKYLEIEGNYTKTINFLSEEIICLERGEAEGGMDIVEVG
jgi:hypothetical protein